MLRPTPGIGNCSIGPKGCQVVIPYLIGSVNRRKNWRAALDIGINNQPLPVTAVEGRITDEDGENLVSSNFRYKPSLYLPTTELLAQLLNPPRTETDSGVQVFDTSRRPALSSYKPDLSICLGWTQRPD